MNRCPLFLSFAISLALSSFGCQSYHARPLNDRTVAEALAIPPVQVLKLRAAQLRNPLLPDTRINLAQGVTPEQAMVLAVLLSPDIRAQRARLGLARAQLFQAGILPNPQVDISVDANYGGALDGAFTPYTFGLSYDLVTLITHDAKVAAARYANASVRLDVAWQEWQLAQVARQAAYDNIALQAQLAEARTIDRLLDENLSLIRGAVDAHQRTLLDLAAAEASAVQAHSIFLGLQRDLQHQRLVLLQAMGFPPDAQIQINPDSRLPLRFTPPDEKSLLTNLALRRLDLLALERGYSSQDQTVRAAILAQFPRLVLGLHQARDNSNIQSAGVGLTFDLPLFDRNQGNIGIENATRQKLFDEYVARIFNARAAISSALVDIESINRQIADTQHALPTLQRLVSTYKQALDQHNADVLSYYFALNNLGQKRLDLIKLQQQLVQAQISLDLAAGLSTTAQSFPPAAPVTMPSTTEPAS